MNFRTEPTSFRLTPPVRWFVLVNLMCGLALLSLVIGWGWGTGRLVDIEGPGRTPPAYQVDVNQADWPEWVQLPGIGPKLGQRIVSYRKQHGHFHQLDELLHVHGIGPRTLDGIREFLVITHESSEANAMAVQEQAR